MNIPFAAKTKTCRADFGKKLLDWYDRHARVMPWRIAPAESKIGLRVAPYHTWLSEVMLQQTQVATVHEYFLKFVAKWPSVTDLAAADTDDVMKAWAGLGYYSRARNLKKCAEVIANEHDGNFPQTADELKKLPGIGDYTAAAIASIAFGEPVAVVDGNVERVIARLYRIEETISGAKPLVKAKVQELLSYERPGDFAQAMMDLGATLCTPKNPACSLCPVNSLCAAFAASDMETFPVKAPKKSKPTRKGAAFVIQRADGAVYLQKRKASGLLGGMSEVPTTEWDSRKDGKTGIKAAPINDNWKECGTIRHTFTHFHLELEVWLARNDAGIGDGWWCAFDELSEEALPTVMKKVIISAMPEAFKKLEKTHGK